MNIDLKDFKGLKYIDVLGLCHGYKKVVSTGVDSGSRARLEKSLSKYGLFWRTVDSGHDYRGRSRTYIISRVPADAERAVKAYSAHRYDIIGSLLGYPACCVRQHYKVCLCKSPPTDDFVRRAASRSRRFFWQLNNALDFDGRLLGERAASFDGSFRYCSLISHNPCSYDCRESLKIAKLNLRFLREQPDFDMAEYSCLSMPILYADDFNLAVLDGKAARGAIIYGRVERRIGLEALKGRLEKSGRVRVKGNSVLLNGVGKAVHEFRPRSVPLILPFRGEV